MYSKMFRSTILGGGDHHEIVDLRANHERKKVNNVIRSMHQQQNNKLQQPKITVLPSVACGNEKDNEIPVSPSV